jgi:hypothetical protein
MSKLLVEVDGEIEQRKIGGNAEHWAALDNLSSTAHAILAMVKTGSQPDPEVDHKLVAMQAVVLLADNQSAWEDEEDSVKAEHRDLIARNNAALYGHAEFGPLSVPVRIPVVGMTPDGFPEPGPAVGDLPFKCDALHDYDPPESGDVFRPAGITGKNTWTD